MAPAGSFFEEQSWLRYPAALLFSIYKIFYHISKSAFPKSELATNKRGVSGAG
tara:strand:+ start:123 stop:281 length:159 start_codon:yes stop_codon:yes gene_type:complete